MVQPYATLKNGDRQLVPRYDPSARLLELKRRYRNFISNPLSLAQFDRFYAGRGIDNCRAGRAFFNIDNFLNVQKCVEFRPETVGNLRDLEPEEMLRCLRLENERNHCRACWYNCRSEVETLYSARGMLAALPMLWQ